MSPILVRPVREQFEHDRVIRELQARYKKKFEVAINPGAEQNASVGIGDLPMFPDLVLFSADRGHKLQGTVEVETTESINTLEAMAEWGPFSRLRAPFFLYIPPSSLDTVRRLCAEHQVIASEIWTYHTAVDQVRFTMVHKEPESSLPKGRLLPKVELRVAPPPPPLATAPTDAGHDADRPERTTMAPLKALKSAAVAKAAEKPSPSDKSAQPVKGAPPVKAAPPLKTAQTASGAQAAKPVQAARPPRASKDVKAAKPAKPMTPAKGAKPVKTAKPARPAKATLPSKAAKSAKPARASAKPAKPGRHSKAPARPASKKTGRSAKAKRR